MFELKSYDDAVAMCEGAATDWLVQLNLNPKPVYAVALSGGRIAVRFFDVLRQKHEMGLKVPEYVHFFWADERCVAPEREESNYRRAEEHLLGPLGISAERVHRIRGEADPGTAAREAERELREVVRARTLLGLPMLDMIFLGMGEDGHAASLFPREAEEGAPPQGRDLGRRDHLPAQDAAAAYRAVIGPKPPPERVTLTYEAIIGARAVWGLVAGEDKQESLIRALNGDKRLPFGRIVRERQATVIYTEAFFSKKPL